MTTPQPTREELDAASLRTIAAHAIAPLERGLRRAEAKLGWVSARELAAPARHRSAAEQVERLRAALDLAHEIVARGELQR